MRVKSVSPAGRADVFNLEVEGTHDFAVNSGVIVHNCFDEIRYMCQLNPVRSQPVVARKPKMYDPLADDEPLNDRYAFYR